MKVSVIIPVKNREALLTETLHSVLAQDYADWEALVVDDSSTDGSFSVANESASKDCRIRAFRLPAGRAGAPACRNYGLQNSNGQFVLFLDSDDLLAPFCLNSRLRVFEENPALDFVIGPAELFGNGLPSGIPFRPDSNEEDLDRFCRRDVPWTTAGPLWKRESLHQVGLWDEELLSWQDWDLHIRALASGLRFERSSRRDWFYRVAEKTRESIGPRSFSPEHFPGHVKAVVNALELLQERRLLTTSRKVSLAGVLFTLAVRYKTARLPLQAAQTFQLIERFSLISPYVLRCARLHLRVARIPLLRKLSRTILQVIQPSFVLMRKRSAVTRPTNSSSEVTAGTEGCGGESEASSISQSEAVAMVSSNK